MSDENKQSVADDIVAQALAEAQAELSAMATDVAAVDTGGARRRGLDLLGDVDLDVTIELGRTEMLVEDVLRLGSGSVVELDKLAGDPVDVFVNGRRVARGEVIVLNDNFCIRISEVVTDLEEQAEQAGLEQQDGVSGSNEGGGGSGEAASASSGETSDEEAERLAQAALDAMGG